MNAAAAWILALVVVLLVGGVATAYIRTVLLQRDATAAGIVALSGMSWREFMRIVLEALASRRYARVVDRETPGSESDYVLARDGDHWLLSCKHGSAFVLGNSAVNELASNIRLQGAVGGLLVTQGRIADEARTPAKLQHIELLDGPTLWPEVRHLIPAAQLAEITAGAAQRARQRMLLAWLCALVAGVVVFIALPRADADADAGVPAAAASAGSSAAMDGGDAAPAAASQPAAAATEMDPTAGAPQPGIEDQRRQIADAISTLPMVDRAVWSTQSTLQVILIETSSDSVAAICPLMLRYPELASSRLLLTPPAGSTAPPRFRQCRSY